MSLLRDHLPPELVWGEDRGHAVPAAFASPDREDAALRRHAALVDLSHQGVVAVTGSDWASWLGGLITNQTLRLTDQQSLYAALLTAQGRFLWDFILVAHPAGHQGVVLLTEPDRVEALIERLSFYLLRSKVQIRDERGAHALLAVVGPEADSRLAGGLAAMSATDGGTADWPSLPPESLGLGATVVFPDGTRGLRDPRHRDFGWRLLIPASRLSAWWHGLATTIQPVGMPAFEHYRLEQALPRGGNELQPDSTLPLEAGLLEMNALDFAKGCYLGQETTARTHHRGTIKKRIYQIILSDGSGLTPGAPVLLPDGKEAGELTSLSGRDGRWLGLARLRVADVDSGQPLVVAGHPVMQVQSPPWAGW